MGALDEARRVQRGVGLLGARARRGRVVAKAVTNSTNDDVLALLEDGDGADPVWVVADRQAAGRGRLGRSWESPPGNLYASVGLSVACPPASAPLVGFIAGVALHEAVATAAPSAAKQLRLKWPNDLLLGGGKLAGVLAESRRRASAPLELAIGFGVNIASAPAVASYATARLHDVAPDVRPLDVLDALRTRFEARLEAWTRARFAFDAVAAAWTERAMLLGSAITVTQAARTLSGSFAGLDAAGRLLIDTPQGRAAIEAGDVALRAPGPSQDLHDEQ